MTDHPTPDPFDEELAARLHAAADGIDGPGVTPASVAGAVDRRRRQQSRTQAVVVGAAAAIALLVGLAIVTQTGGDPPEQVRSGSPTTTIAEPCGSLPSDGPAPTVSSEPSDDPGASLAGPHESASSDTTTTLGGSEGDAAFDEWIAVLRERGLVTMDQETALAAGERIDLTPEQSAALQEHYDEQSADATTTAPAFAPAPTTATTAPCAVATTTD